MLWYFNYFCSLIGRSIDKKVDNFTKLFNKATIEKVVQVCCLFKHAFNKGKQVTSSRLYHQSSCRLFAKTKRRQIVASLRRRGNNTLVFNVVLSPIKLSSLRLFFARYKCERLILTSRTLVSLYYGVRWYSRNLLCCCSSSSSCCHDSGSSRGCGGWCRRRERAVTCRYSEKWRVLRM